MPNLAPTIGLQHGALIPAIGYGTWPLRGAEGVTAVRAAIETGYRLIDTAENYRNEDAIGQAVRESGIDRGELFITTKFNRAWHSVAGARQAWQASTENLGTDYIDLLLIHWPNPDQGRYVDAVRGLGALLRDGSVRAIGTSNFKPTHLQDVLEQTGITPDVNQIQLNPYSTRDDVRRYHAEHKILTESWRPIGGPDADLRSEPVITRLAERHGKTPTQVVLRWHVQHELVPIPKSADPGRMAENLAIFDFVLTDAEMAAIDALDRGDDDVADSDEVGH